MSQHIERTEALRKLRTYVDQTADRGRSEAEVNKALDMMNRLMTQFNITMSEISISETPCVTVKIDTGSAIDLAVNHTARAIADFCDCIYYRNRGGQEIIRDEAGKPILKETRRGYKYVTRRANTSYVFFGQEQDTEMATFLYQMIKDVIDLETRVYKKTAAYLEYRGPKKSASHSFQHGMAGRISYRLNRMKEEQTVEVEAAQAGGQDLMVIKSKHVESEFTTTGTKLIQRKTAGPRIRAYGAHNQGSAAGDRVNLSRPVGTGANKPLLLA
jgi:hypothetical protein